MNCIFKEQFKTELKKWLDQNTHLAPSKAAERLKAGAPYPADAGTKYG